MGEKGKPFLRFCGGDSSGVFSGSGLEIDKRIETLEVLRYLVLSRM